MLGWDHWRIFWAATLDLSNLIILFQDRLLLRPSTRICHHVVPLQQAILAIDTFGTFCLISHVQLITRYLVCIFVPCHSIIRKQRAMLRGILDLLIQFQICGVGWLTTTSSFTFTAHLLVIKYFTAILN